MTVGYKARGILIPSAMMTASAAAVYVGALYLIILS